MKHSIKILCIVTTLVLTLTSCRDSLTDREWAFALPENPDSWALIPAAYREKMRWRVEYIAAGGQWRSAGPGDGLDLGDGWPSPVLAWPYIPDTTLQPGILKPAGAVFPFDVSGGEVKLTWQGGVDAFWYRQMAAAWAEADENARLRGGIFPDERRKPQFFDWPRWRNLFSRPGDGGNLPLIVLKDPWRADWKAAAQAIVRSGFDARRIKPLPETALIAALETVGGAGGFGSASPFAGFRVFDGPNAYFTVTESPSVWFSPAGVLKAAGTDHMFLHWQEP